MHGTEPTFATRVGRWRAFAAAATLLATGLTVLTSVARDLTRIEAGFLQSSALILSAFVAYAFTRSDTHAAAQQAVRAQARPALRRLLVSAEATKRVREAIERGRSQLKVRSEQGRGRVQYQEVELVLNGLEDLVEVQLMDLLNSVEDWQDLVPDPFDRAEQFEASKEADDGTH